MFSLPITHDVVLAFGAIFAIGKFSFCIECDETKHAEKSGSKDPPSLEKNKAQPCDEEQVAKRQKVEVIETLPTRTCHSCGLQKAVVRWRHKESMLLCDPCVHRIRRAKLLAQPATVEKLPDNTPSATMQVDLSCGKAVVYTYGSETRHGVVIDTTIVLRNSNGFFTAKATDVVFCSVGWRSNSELRLRDGRVGTVVGTPTIEMVGIRLDRGCYQVEPCFKVMEIWRIVSNFECQVRSAEMLNYNMLRFSGIDFSVGKCVELAMLKGGKIVSRRGLIATNKVWMYIEQIESKVSATEIVSRTDAWNIGSVLTLKDGRRGVLTQKPKIAVNIFRPGMAYPNKTPTMLYIAQLKANAANPNPSGEWVDYSQKAFGSRTVEQEQ
jgi:hypothetical protein